MSMKMLLILGIVFALIGGLACLSGCATPNGNATPESEKEKIEKIIGHVQRLETAITWIAPIACTAVAVAAPEAVPACQMAVASANALKVVTDQAIAAYRADPSAANAEAITDVLGKLKVAWSNLDSAYKGDSSALKASQPQSRIHPWKGKRHPVTGLPSSRSLFCLQSLQSLRT